MSWSEFLRIHWDGIAAADFFTVEALTLTGLTRFHVLFVIELKTRIVHIAGIVCNLLDAVHGFLRGKKYLILDRDPMFTAQFRRLLSDSLKGVRSNAVEPRGLAIPSARQPRPHAMAFRGMALRASLRGGPRVS